MIAGDRNGRNGDRQPTPSPSLGRGAQTGSVQDATEETEMGSPRKDKKEVNNSVRLRPCFPPAGHRRTARERTLSRLRDTPFPPAGRGDDKSGRRNEGTGCTADGTENAVDIRSNSAFFLGLGCFFCHFSHHLSLSITVWRPDGQGAAGILVREVIDFLKKRPVRACARERADPPPALPCREKARPLSPLSP